MQRLLHWSAHECRSLMCQYIAGSALHENVSTAANCSPTQLLLSTNTCILIPPPPTHTHRCTLRLALRR
jgi:hypothetical protein